MRISDFINELEKLNIEINDEKLSLLEKYYNYLVEYNSHTNLTTINGVEDVYLKHFYDSLTLVKTYDFNKNINLLDIGTGAGFPGVVLKIFYPSIKLTLLDSNAKKTKFLTILVEKLDLDDVEIINDRAENFINKKRESFDVVTSRAVAKMRILAELGLPFLKNNGILLIMKASREVLDAELMESKKTFEVLNSEIKAISEFKLPIENSERNIVVIEKKKNIQDIYPRSYDKILKKPLK